jgi:hypothetical protein
MPSLVNFNIWDLRVRMTDDELAAVMSISTSAFAPNIKKKNSEIVNSNNLASTDSDSFDLDTRQFSFTSKALKNTYFHNGITLPL